MDKIDEKILKFIEKNRVSGERLAKYLNISRTAIWKRIKKLEKLGYQIEHSPEGYKLIKETPFITPYSFKKHLKTKWLGKNYIFFEEVNSTNVYAKENNLPDGTVILAEYQTSGKGRKGRIWLSPKGKGLYFSIVLKRSIPVAHLLNFSLLFPLSVKNVIEKHAKIPVKIKWPNDLYINEKKFAGFLIETDIENNQIEKVIAGIGININDKPEDFENIDIATSLFIETGETFNRKQIFAEILLEIEKNIEEFEPKKVIKEVEGSLLWKGEKVKILDENISGILLGLNEIGGLRIFTDNGIKDIYSGDLSLRREK